MVERHSRWSLSSALPRGENTSAPPAKVSKHGADDEMEQPATLGRLALGKK